MAQRNGPPPRPKSRAQTPLGRRVDRNPTPRDPVRPVAETLAPPEPPVSRKRRALRSAGRILGALGLGGIFVASLGAAVVLHINMPASRRAAASVVGSALSGTFHGEMTVGNVDRLNLRGATLSEVTVKDEAGNTVVVLTDVRIRTNVIALLEEVLTAEDKVTVVVRHIRAERAEVLIVPDPETGIPTIARALTPRPTPKKEPSAPSAPSRALRVWLPSIEIKRVFGRGHVAGLPTLEVALSGVRGSVLATPKGAAVDVHRYGMIVRGLGGTDAKGTGELHVRAPGAVWSSFDGYFGGLPLTANVHVKGSRVTATADVPKAQPEDVRALFSDWPLHEPVSAHVEVSGDVPELYTNARFEVGDTRLRANGPITFGPDFKAKLDVEGRSVDIRAIWPKAPRTKVDTDAALTISGTGGRVVVDVNGSTAPTAIAGQPIPAMDVTGTFNEKGFDGKATLHETGMPVKAAFTIHPDGAIDVDARARSFQLERAPRVAKLTDARGRADMHVKARIEKNRLDATLVADVRKFELGDVNLDRGHITGRARGPITEPEKLTIDAKINGTALEARGMSFDKVDATAKGSAFSPSVTAKLTDEHGPEVNAKAVVVTKDRPGLRNLELQVKREDATLAGKIARLDFDQKDVQIDNLRLTGAGGELAGEVRVGTGFVSIKAKGDGLDLDVMSRALGLPRGTLGGKVNIDADLVASKRESRGHIKLGLGNGSIASVSGVSLNLDAKLDGEAIEGNASALVEGLGKVGAAWNAKLTGNPADPKAWRSIVGEAELQASDVELAPLRHLLPKSARIEKIAGTAFARVKLERLAPDELPNARVEIAGTRGLEVVRAPAEKGGEPLVIKGIEIEMNGGVHGERGDASGTTMLRDGLGILVSSSGSVRMDWNKLLSPEPRVAGVPEEDDSFTDRVLDQVMEAPLLAVVIMPERSLEHLPEWIRPEGLRGSVGGRVMLSGSVSEPRLAATVDANGIASANSRRVLPVDMRASAEFEVATGQYGATIDLSQARRRVARLVSRGTANIVDGSWTGGAQLALDQTPLGIIPLFAEGRVQGHLTGPIVLQRRRADEPPLLSANVSLAEASVDSIPVGNGTVQIRSDGRQVNAEAELDDGLGRLNATLRAGIDWTSPLPELDANRQVRITVDSRAYDAVVLSPFLRDIFSRLSGKVDGRLTTTFTSKKDAEGKPLDEWEADVDGVATMSEGVVQIAPLGIEFSKVRLTARASEQGKFTVISIRDLVGTARSDAPNLSANANVYLEGVRVVRGDGAISVKNVPILFEGVSQATATGLATLKLERETGESESSDDDRMVVTVDIGNMVARLPQASSRTVVSLSDHPSIEVVQPLKEPSRRSTGPVLPWRLVFNLKRGVRLKRSDLDLPLSGQPTIDLGGQTVVAGFVELEPGGRFQSWGKTFVIEVGRVRFDTPDPGNPSLTTTASWRSPDGTIVYLDLRGTLKEAKLTLTSDPARSEPEIFGILFGTTSSTDEASAGRARGSAAAGGIATGINPILSEALGGSVELRTATQEDKASYTAAVRVSENVWFEGTYRNRLEAQQETAGTETVDVSGTIDWRFRRNWSLRTEVGTLGTGLDLLWQYRY